MLRIRIRVLAAITLVASLSASLSHAQPFGVEMQNNVLPVAGGMGGASIARPQELLAGLNANPATLTQFGGTQFQFGGGWAYADFELTQTGALQVPGVTPFSDKSGAPGVALANIGMTRQVDFLGIDSTMGVGLISNAGAGVDFRAVPASNRASSNMLVLEIESGFGMKLTDRLSLGTTVSLGSGYFDGPFVGNGAMVQAYGLRAALGANYDLTDATSLGCYWQTKQHFVFEDAVGLQLFNGNFDVTRDVNMDLPSTVGLGIANRRLFDGRLLLAMDVVYKNWENADLFESVYRDQWAFQLGTQYSINRLRLRAGYAYAMNPLKTVTVSTAGGVTLPGATAAVQYLQSQFALINQNRLSCGVGIVDLRPGLDVDMHAGIMPSEGGSTGQFTSVRVSSYWVGLGMSYRFGNYGLTAK